MSAYTTTDAVCLECARAEDSTTYRAGVCVICQTEQMVARLEAVVAAHLTAGRALLDDDTARPLTPP